MKFGVVVPVSADEKKAADIAARKARMERAAERRNRPATQRIDFALKVALVAAKNRR